MGERITVDTAKENYTDVDEALRLKGLFQSLHEFMALADSNNSKLEA